MEETDSVMVEWVGSARDVRAQVTETADLKATIAFQNDVNALLASVAALDAPGPRLPSGVEALFGILPGRAALRKLRQAGARLRSLLSPGAQEKAGRHRPRRLRTNT